MHTFTETTQNMAKNKVFGRPKGPNKKAINVFLPIEKITKLKERAETDHRTISTVVELALEKDGI